MQRSTCLLSPLLPAFSGIMPPRPPLPIPSSPKSSKRKSTSLQSTPAAHTDIPSFLRHAILTSLNPTTTVFTGTLYEYTVLSALSRCLPGISLTRVGGRDDAGIDLTGTWHLPKPPRRPSQKKEEEKEEEEFTPLPLTIQCKNVQQKSWKGPQYIRELEGSLTSQPPNALGILASVRDITPGMKKQMLSSRRALGFVKVTPLEAIYGDKIIIQKYGDEDQPVEFKLTGRGGLLQQFAWNEVANRYIGGFGIGARYVERNYAIKGVELREFLHDPTGKGNDGGEEGEELEQEITLIWNGTPVSA
ncbi:hypothetical protein TWF481_005864 [Arthrobotrys musiformis]|uniref:Uncharacterized protein n=1 Tax=Arthrobotrys musiformis TaxID=47236 RepID=A0AAV9WF10_9PEZI